MKIEFDPAKDEVNREKHGLSLADAEWFDFDVAVVEVDRRRDYGETRYGAFARIEGIGYCLAYAATDDTIRPISFRRAHEKELARYE